MTDTDLRNEIEQIVDYHSNYCRESYLGTELYSHKQATDKLLALIHERERKAKLHMLILLKDVINNTPTDKNNMEYFIELHKQELEEEMGYDQTSK